MKHTVLFDLTPLSTSTQTRGIGRYLQTLALGLAQLSSSERSGLRLLALTRLDFGTFNVTEDFETAAFSNGDRLGRVHWALSRRFALWKAARAVGASAVVLGDPNATPFGLRRIGCRSLVTCHDLIPLRYPQKYLDLRHGSLLGFRIVARRYRSADRILAISEATRGDLTRLLKISPKLIDRVHNGVNLADWSDRDPGDDRARLHRLCLHRKPFLLFVGDTDWRKNVEGMITSLALCQHRGIDVELAFAGVLGTGRVKRILQIANHHGVVPRIRLLGYVEDEDLRALYRSAVGLMFVSRAEGFGYPMLEAMASGCPVIASDAEALVEVGGSAAIYVQPDDPRHIASAIARLSTSSEIRAHTSKKGIARSRAFSCERQARGTIEAVRTMLSQPRTLT